MNRTQRSFPRRGSTILVGAALLAGACFLPFARDASARGPTAQACRTPDAALRRYVNAANAGDFDSQYALFAPVEHGSAPAPILLLPAHRLQRLLASMHPPFPSGLKLSAHPLNTERIGAAARPSVVGLYLVPVLEPGRPAPPGGRYSGSYVVAVQPSSEGWKVRAYATYWMYFQRAYGATAGQQFCRAYQREVEQLGLMRRSGQAAAPIRGTTNAAH